MSSKKKVLFTARGAIETRSEWSLGKKRLRLSVYNLSWKQRFVCGFSALFFGTIDFLTILDKKNQKRIKEILR